MSRQALFAFAATEQRCCSQGTMQQHAAAVFQPRKYKFVNVTYCHIQATPHYLLAFRPFSRVFGLVTLPSECVGKTIFFFIKASHGHPCGSHTKPVCKSPALLQGKCRRVAATVQEKGHKQKATETENTQRTQHTATRRGNTLTAEA